MKPWDAITRRPMGCNELVRRVSFLGIHYFDGLGNRINDGRQSQKGKKRCVLQDERFRQSQLSIHPSKTSIGSHVRAPAVAA